MIDENKDCWLTNQCNHIDCNRFCMKHYKLKYLYDAALISASQRKYVGLVVDKDGTDLKEFQILSMYAMRIEDIVKAGKNIYIHSSSCGNGKTSWALRIVESYFDKIWYSSEMECRALFISVPQFLLALKANIAEKNDYVQYIKDNVLTADIIIWDDIATKDSTVFEAENLLSMMQYVSERLRPRMNASASITS